AMAIKMPMIRTTTISSMRVNPASSARRSLRSLRMSFLHPPSSLASPCRFGQRAPPQYPQSADLAGLPGNGDRGSACDRAGEVLRQILFIRRGGRSSLGRCRRGGPEAAPSAMLPCHLEGDLPAGVGNADGVRPVTVSLTTESRAVRGSGRGVILDVEAVRRLRERGG